MKILHVVGDSKFGGDSVIICRLAQLAQSLGWQVEVLTTDPTFQEFLRKVNISVVPLEAIWREIRPFQDLQGVYRLYRFLKSENYTIVHTHTSKGGFVGRLAARLANVPIILHTVHGFAFHEQSSPSALRFYATLERLAANLCDLIVTLTEFHRQWALELGIGNKDKIVTIANGISPKRVQTSLPLEQVRHFWGVNQDEMVILSAARLAPQKGIEYLIDAIPFLIKHLNRPFRIVLAGDGPLSSQLEDRVKNLGVQKYVIFLGFRSDVGDLLAASDIVVIPSLWEGLSISLLEAMAAGKPIITTTIGSNIELLSNRENALLISPKDSQALAQAIIELAQNPELLHNLSTEAKALFESSYSEERMLQKYKEVYLKLLEQKGIADETP